MTELEDIYIQFFDDVYRYCICLCKDEILAEEITQETFFKALKNIKNFKGECKITVWLCQIAKHTYLNCLDKDKKVDNNFFQDDNMEDYCGRDVQEKLVMEEAAFKIHKKLHELKEPYKEVFSLRVFGELSFSKIGELFEKSESWARVTFHRAKMKLKETVK